MTPVNSETAMQTEAIIEYVAERQRFRPYPTYRDSGVEWLGQVPERWELRRVKQVTRFAYGDSLSADNRNDGDVDVFGSNGPVGRHDTANTCGPCLVIGRKGSFGKVNYSPKPCFTIDTTYFIDRTQTRANMCWLYYVLSWLRLDSFSKDSAVPGLAREDAYGRWLPYCELGEQQAIAAFLDRETARIDELIAKKQRLIELLAEKRTALISHAVTKGLNPDALMKDSGIEWFGQVPNHWEITRLGWVTNEVSDINHEMPVSASAGVAFLSAKDLLDDGTLNFSDAIKRISEDDFERLSRKSRPRRGDIIYSRIGACLGKARLVEADERFLVSYSCCVVRVNSSVADRRFFRHLLDAEMVLTEAKIRTQGIGVPDLGLSEICRFPVPLPPIDEQREIANYLDEKEMTLRSLSTRINDGLEQLREYRSALISAAVTGKIDVRGFQPKEAPCQ